MATCVFLIDEKWWLLLFTQSPMAIPQRVKAGQEKTQ
jgi:hypothetical protein